MPPRHDALMAQRPGEVVQKETKADDPADRKDGILDQMGGRIDRAGHVYVDAEDEMEERQDGGCQEL